MSSQTNLTVCNNRYNDPTTASTCQPQAEEARTSYRDANYKIDYNNIAATMWLQVMRNALLWPGET